jgi:hypothetical protein
MQQVNLDRCILFVTSHPCYSVLKASPRRRVLGRLVRDLESVCRVLVRCSQKAGAAGWHDTERTWTCYTRPKRPTECRLGCHASDCASRTPKIPSLCFCACKTGHTMGGYIWLGVNLTNPAQRRALQPSAPRAQLVSACIERTPAQSRQHPAGSCMTAHHEIAPVAAKPVQETASRVPCPRTQHCPLHQHPGSIEQLQQAIQLSAPLPVMDASASMLGDGGRTAIPCSSPAFVSMGNLDNHDLEM